MAWQTNYSIDCLFVWLALLEQLSNTLHDLFSMQILLSNNSGKSIEGLLSSIKIYLLFLAVFDQTS